METVLAERRLSGAALLSRLSRPRWWDALILPALILIVLAFGIPVVTIMARSVTDHAAGGGALSNFEWFFGSGTQIKVLLRTIETAAIVTLVCLIVAYPFAYLLTVVGSRWRVALLGLVVVSAWQSILVRNYGWRVTLNEKGPLNEALSAVGLGPGSLLGTTVGVVIAMSQVMAPFMILPLYACLRGIDRRLLQAARSLGANPVTAFVKVYLPLSFPGAVAGSVLVAVLSLGEFITPALVGSTQNALLPQAIQLEVGRSLNWGHIGAQSVILVAAVILAMGVLRALSKDGSGLPARQVR